MPGHVLGSFFVYVMINAFTPGPGNILALNTVTNYGWRRGKPLFFGIFAGYYVVQLLCALFVYGVSTFLPGMLRVMKYVGAAYIFYLALHIARSTPEPAAGDRSASFLKGFLLQFVNVKIWLFGITTLTGYVTDFYTGLSALVFFEGIVATVGSIATLTWIGMGAALERYYRNYYRPINMVLALILLECIYGMLR